MPGSGSTLESEQDFADRLIAAYSQRYREAGRWKTASWIGSAGLFLAGLILVCVDMEVAAVGLVASVYLLSSRLILRPEMTRAHREGVVLQEQYDTQRFSLPWNPALAGREISIVDVEALAGRYRGDISPFADWYVECGLAPQGAATLLRQLENATWGRLDHRRFAIFSVLTLIVSIGATVAVGLLRDVTLAAYVSALVLPALPWLLDLVDLATLHWSASCRREEIEVEATDLWSSTADGSAPLTQRLRSLQDRIFIARRSYGRVPSWFYRFFSKRNHDAFRAAARRMLKDRGWLPVED